MIAMDYLGPRVTCEACLAPIGPDYRSEQDFGEVLWRGDALAFVHAKCRGLFATTHHHGGAWRSTGLLVWLAQILENSGFQVGDLQFVARQRREQLAHEQRAEQEIADAEAERYYVEQYLAGADPLDRPAAADDLGDVPF